MSFKGPYSKNKLLLLSGLLGTVIVLMSYLYGRRNIVSIQSSLGERLEVPRNTFVRYKNLDLYSIIVDSFKWSRKRQSHEFDSCKAALLLSDYRQECMQAQAYYEHYRIKFMASAWNPVSLMKQLGLERMGLEKLFQDHPDTSTYVLSSSKYVLTSRIDKVTVKMLPSLSYRAIMTDLNGRKTVHRIIDRQCFHPSLSALVKDSAIAEGIDHHHGPQAEFANNSGTGLRRDAIEALHYEVCRSQGLKYLPPKGRIESGYLSEMRPVLDSGYLDAARQRIKQAQGLREQQERLGKEQLDKQKGIDANNRFRQPTASQLLEAVPGDPFQPGS